MTAETNPQVIAIGGAVARLAGDSLEDNPHDPASGAWLIWRYGWHTKCRRDLANGEPSHVKQGAKRRRPGRGHGAAGPRSEWPAGELEALALCTGWIKDREIAALLGPHRTALAVRTQRKRQKARTV